jgi:hypothetical protein
MVNANLDDLYLQNAINEAEGVYLREILGDLLYNAIINKIDSQTLTGKYATLVDQYIKIYLKYKAQSLLVPQVAFKIRNAGVISQYDQGFSTTSVKDTMYVQEQIDSKAEFYANRLTVYLQKNADSFPEYGYSEDNITQPTESQNVTTIYLGTGRKKCGCTPTKGGGGGGTADAVEWENILNKPQPTIGAGVVTLRQGGIEQSFDVNSTENLTIELSDGVTDYNELQNKPDLSVFAPKATVYTKTEIDLLTDRIYGQIGAKANQTSLDTHTGNSTIHVTAADKENWNGKANADSVYTKSEIDTKVTTINQQIGTKASQTSLDTHTGNGTIHVTAADKENWNGKTTMAAVEAKGYAVAGDLATVATSGSYADLSNKPAINNGTLTIQKNGTTVATFTANDSTDQTANITVPANETDLGLSSETWSFTLSDGTTVTKTVVIK